SRPVQHRVGSGTPDRERRRPVRTRRWLLPALALVVWVVVAGIGAPSIMGLSGLEENNSAAWLPESAESAQALHRLTEVSGSQTAAAAVVAERDSGITATDRRFMAQALESVAGTGGFSDRTLGPLPSADGEALVGGVDVAADDRVPDEVGRLHE